MINKELIKTEIDRIRDEDLDELYELIKRFAQSKKGREQLTFVERLLESQSDGPTNMTANYDHYVVNTETTLAQRLTGIRKRIIASGEPLMNWEEIGHEVAERRGGEQVDEEDFR